MTKKKAVEKVETKTNLAPVGAPSVTAAGIDEAAKLVEQAARSPGHGQPWDDDRRASSRGEDPHGGGEGHPTSSWPSPRSTPSRRRFTPSAKWRSCSNSRCRSRAAAAPDEVGPQGRRGQHHSGERRHVGRGDVRLLRAEAHGETRWRASRSPSSLSPSSSPLRRRRAGNATAKTGITTTSSTTPATAGVQPAPDAAAVVTTPHT